MNTHPTSYALLALVSGLWSLVADFELVRRRDHGQADLQLAESVGVSDPEIGLAQELSVRTGADGSAEQNIALTKAVMQKLAANGGKVPDSLKD